MKSLAEYFQAFDSYAVENELSASSRTLYYTLLGMFNERFWKVESVSISVRDMQVRGGFQSSSAVERAKTILGTENIVKINKLKNRKTQYQLVDPQYWLRNNNVTRTGQIKNTNGTPKGQLQNTCGASPFIKYTLNESTEEDGEDGKDTKNARMCVSGNAEYGNLSEKIKNAWIARRDYLSTDEAYELRRLEIKVNDTDLLERAIREATTPFKTTNNPISFLEGVLRNKAAMKESESNDRRKNFDIKQGDEGNGITTDYDKGFFE